MRVAGLLLVLGLAAADPAALRQKRSLTFPEPSTLLVRTCARSLALSAAARLSRVAGSAVAAIRSPAAQKRPGFDLFARDGGFHSGPIARAALAQTGAG